MTKCQDCMFGGILEGAKHSVYKLKIAIKYERIIKYSKGELGCRSNVNDEKERKCLSNNFSEFVQFHSLDY